MRHPSWSRLDPVRASREILPVVKLVCQKRAVTGFVEILVFAQAKGRAWKI